MLYFIFSRFKRLITHELFTFAYQGPVLEWSTKPIRQADCEVILESPPFQFPFDNLVNNYLEQDDLTIFIHMTDSNLNNDNNRKEIISLDSFTVLQAYACSRHAYVHRSSGNVLPRNHLRTLTRTFNKLSHQDS